MNPLALIAEGYITNSFNPNKDSIKYEERRTTSLNPFSRTISPIDFESGGTMNITEVSTVAKHPTFKNTWDAIPFTGIIETAANAITGMVGMESSLSDYIRGTTDKIKQTKVHDYGSYISKVRQIGGY